MNSSHVTALTSKHAGLEAQLHDEMNRPRPDEDRLKRLKQEKLRIKQELASG